MMNLQDVCLLGVTQLLGPWHQNYSSSLVPCYLMYLWYSAWVLFTATAESTALQRCAIQKSGCCRCSPSGGLQEHLAPAAPNRPGLGICL